MVQRLLRVFVVIVRFPFFGIVWGPVHFWLRFYSASVFLRYLSLLYSILDRVRVVCVFKYRREKNLVFLKIWGNRLFHLFVILWHRTLVPMRGLYFSFDPNRISHELWILNWLRCFWALFIFRWSRISHSIYWSFLALVRVISFWNLNLLNRFRFVKPLKDIFRLFDQNFALSQSRDPFP